MTDTNVLWMTESSRDELLPSRWVVKAEFAYPHSGVSVAHTQLRGLECQGFLWIQWVWIQCFGKILLPQKDSTCLQAGPVLFVCQIKDTHRTVTLVIMVPKYERVGGKLLWSNTTLQPGQCSWVKHPFKLRICGAKKGSSIQQLENY